MAHRSCTAGPETSRISRSSSPPQARSQSNSSVSIHLGTVHLGLFRQGRLRRNGARP